MEKIALDEAAKIELRIDSIEPVDDIGRLRLAVKVRNLPRTVLDSEGENPGYLVYRWIDAASGRLVVAESPGLPFSAPVLPQGEGRFDLLVTPPEEPGRYLLRATIVQHLHYWFDHPPVNVFSEVPHEIESWPDEDIPDVPFVGRHGSIAPAIGAFSLRPAGPDRSP